MKKITIPFTLLFTLSAALIFFQSCSKNELKKGQVEKTINDPISYYSSKFLTDEVFIKFATTTISNNLKINRILKSGAINKITTLDSIAVYNAAAENVTAEFILSETHPTFVSLSEPVRNQILSNVRDSLTSVSFRQTNPTNALIVYELSLIPQLYEMDSIAVARFDYNNISSSEFWNCAIISLGTGLLSYGDVLGQVGSLFRAGGSILRWSDVFSIAYTVVKNSTPWWKVAGLALEFGGCLWSAGNS